MKSLPDTVSESRSVVVERELAFTPEKIWRALTQAKLIEQWLMKNDFAPVVGHHFKLTADWGQIDCQVLLVEPDEVLSYTWNTMGLDSVVTWTLTPAAAGTRLHVEHTGFRPDQDQVYQGAQYGWQQFFGNLERFFEKGGVVS